MGQSIILEKVTRPKERPRFNENERLALSSFYELKATKQQCRLHVDDWRNEFKRRHTGDNEKSKARAQVGQPMKLVNLQEPQIFD